MSISVQVPVPPFNQESVCVLASYLAGSVLPSPLKSQPGTYVNVPEPIQAPSMLPVLDLTHQTLPVPE